MCDPSSRTRSWSRGLATVLAITLAVLPASVAAQRGRPPPKPHYGGTTGASKGSAPPVRADGAAKRDLLGMAMPPLMGSLLAAEALARPRPVPAMDSLDRFHVPSNLKDSSFASTVVLDALPKTVEEFQSVYGNARASDEQEARKATDSLSRPGVARIVVRTGKDVLDRISDAAEKHAFVVIVGHNEGGRLRMPGRGEVLLEQVAGRCLQAQVLCVILSCNSTDHIGSPMAAIGVPRSLSFAQAAKIADTVASEVRKLQVTLTALQRRYDKATEPPPGWTFSLYTTEADAIRVEADAAVRRSIQTIEQAASKSDVKVVELVVGGVVIAVIFTLMDDELLSWTARVSAESNWAARMFGFGRVQVSARLLQ